MPRALSGGGHIFLKIIASMKGVVVLAALLSFVLVAAFRTISIPSTKKHKNNFAATCAASQRLASSSIFGGAPSWQWWRDLVTGTEENTSKPSKSETVREDDTAIGKVLRCGARKYDKDASKPSSRAYTTKKSEFPIITVSKSGVVGDYNHYRTTALSSTEDRAVSILTYDVIQGLQNEGKFRVQPGDLGENILVDGLNFGFFQLGKRYQFGAEENDGGGGVILKITEPIVPCANLCKLPYINDNKLKPKDRIERCNDFLERLGRNDGVRGWYAKVVNGGGPVHLGDEVRLLS